MFKNKNILITGGTGSFGKCFTKELRDLGHIVELDLRGKNIGKTLDWASKNGFTNVVIVGPQDLENSRCSIKNLTTGDQDEAGLDSASISSVL